MAHNSEKHRPTVGNRKLLFVTIGMISLIVLGLLVAILSSNQTISDSADDMTRVALELTADYARELELILSATATATPTPSVTPFPTLAPAQWGVRYNPNAPRPELIKETSGNLNITEAEKIDISYPNLPVPANFYVQSGSQIQFTAVSNSIRLKFLKGEIFINTGQYRSVISEIEFAPGIEFSVAGSCMALQFELRTNELSAWCFEGICSHHNTFSQQSTIIATGTRVVWLFDPETRQLTPSRSEMISLADANRYEVFIASLDRERTARLCISTYLPTPIPGVASLTPIVPTVAPSQTPVRTVAPSQTPVPVRTVAPSPTSAPVTNPIGVITNTPIVPTPIPPSPIPPSPIPPSPIPPSPIPPSPIPPSPIPPSPIVYPTNTIEPPTPETSYEEPTP